MNLEKDEKTILKEFDDKIKDAEENEGDIEVRDAIFAKAEYYLEKGDRVNARLNLKKVLEKTAGNQKKLEYNLLILHTFYQEDELGKFGEYLEICNKLNEEGGDWEKKNKLDVYRGIMMMIRREFSQASLTFLGCVNTFNASEIISFEKLVFYGAVLGILTLPRKTVKEKIIDNSDVVSILLENSLLQDFIFSFYQSNYQGFFKILLRITERDLDNDKFLKPHKNYILKQARICIYRQYLESYKTVTLEKMSRDFKVSTKFIDKELSEFIASGRIKSQIDRVNGVVESSKEEERIELYKEIMKKGDHLIEKMHTLMRKANI